MERWNSLPFIVRQIMLGVLLFVLGAALSFAYSYRPLHGALTWKVDSLEARLDERNIESTKLKDELARLEKQAKTSVDAETLAQVEAELSRTKAALKKSESVVELTERKRRDANSSADRWRKRYQALRDDQSALPAAKAPSSSAPSLNPAQVMPAVDAAAAKPKPISPSTLPSTPALPVPTEPNPAELPPPSDAPALP